MNDDMEDSFEEVDVLPGHIKTLERDLPLPIRRFLRSPERDAIALTLARKYQLHTDQAGVFESAYLLMLLGVYAPDDFVSELKETGINESAIRGLTADINELVFKPLQNEERIEPAINYQASSEPVRQGTLSDVPVPQIKVSNPDPSISTKPIGLPQNLITNPPQLVPAEPAQSLVRTMSHDMELLQHPELVGHATPASSFQTASIPVTSVPAPRMSMPNNSVPVPPIPPQIRDAMARSPNAPVPQMLPGSRPPTPVRSEPLVQKHTGDPYREPLD
jgi:hypothetical protein